MSTLPEPPDDRDLIDFGPPPPAGLSRELRADDRPAKRWAHLRERLGGRLAWLSPIDAVPELVRVRALPSMPWPLEWGEIARRCRSYPGDMIGLVGGEGSGKTQFAIQMARAFIAAERGAVCWANLELLPTDVDLRIVANLTKRHVVEIREGWPERQIVSALATVNDRWVYVDRAATVDGQLANIDETIKAAIEIYGAPPLVVVDYLQILGLLADAREQRGAMAQAIEALRRMAERHRCWILAISQTSRGNAPALRGQVEHESAADVSGAGAETAQLERAAAVQIVLNVFKGDDTPILDVHVNVSKARHTGAEGRTGARYHKAGGVWEELDHLPATPVEIKAEVKKRKRRKPAEDGTPKAEPTPTAARADINAERAEEAASARRAAVIAALRAAGAEGMGGRDLRRVRGSGSPTRLQATLRELEAAGRVQLDGGRHYFVK